MLPLISLFPASLPDETLYSRVSRYHFLVGNKSLYKTYDDLFGTTPFRLEAILPKQVNALVNRLPGDPQKALAAIISQNTLIPLYQPFLGRPDNATVAKSQPISSASRIPRRAVDDHGEARLCLLCVESDAREHGVAYWRRSHQAPKVASCWKHGVDLLKSCPECFRPFLRAGQLLSILWLPCECGWSCDSGEAKKTTDVHYHQYAILANAVLESGMLPIEGSILSMAYRRQAIKRGYNYGSLVSLKRLEESMVTQLGEEFIQRADQAYQLGRKSNWIRFSVLNGYLDMPISRHILLIMFLFKDFANFRDQIEVAANLLSSSSPSTNTDDDSASKKRTYREKILQVRKRWPTLVADGFWTKAYTATTWLYNHDHRWLQTVIDPSSVQSPPTASKDAEYASIIEQKVDALYCINAYKPLRVNRERMLKLLPKKIARGRDLPVDYPLVQSQLEQHMESLWHFHLRRVLWGIMELARFKLVPGFRTLSVTTGINIYRCRIIVDFYDLDLAGLTSARFDPQFELSKLSVSNRFEGPPEADGNYGGRAYKKKRPRPEQVPGLYSEFEDSESSANIVS
ncbi:TniQ family protein [Pseudomonas mohnii]